MGYQQRRKKAKKKYRYSENGKKTRIEAERRRRLRIPSDKSKKDKGIRKKKQLLSLLSLKQNNPATISVNKVNRIKTSKRGEKNHGKKKSTKGNKEVCHLCGAEGTIVKRISWNCETEHPHFSFRLKRWGKMGKKNWPDKEGISTRPLRYWQKE